MKALKRATLLFLVLIITVLSVMGVSAKTIYEYYGYSFSILTNTTVSLCGWDNRTEELIVPDSIMNRYVVEIDNLGFSGASGFSSIDFSQAEHLTKIGFYSFEGCADISEPLSIPENVTKLMEGAFKNCTSIPSVTINANINSIEREVFYNCSSLKTVSLPDSINSIDVMAFAKCTSLERVDIPRSVTFIDSYAFDNTPNLNLGVYYDSYAYHFAIRKSIPYILLDNVKLGDADGDGSVSITDVTKVQRYLAELDTLEGIYLHAADVNQDGSVDISDATVIQMYLADYALTYPIDEIMAQ